MLSSRVQWVVVLLWHKQSNDAGMLTQHLHGHRRISVCFALFFGVGILLAIVVSFAHATALPVRALAAVPTATAMAGGTGKIAFWGNRGQDHQSVVICTMNADGSDEHCWTAPANVPENTSAVWLPNGQQLAFLAGDGWPGDGPVVVMNDDGNGQQG